MASRSTREWAPRLLGAIAAATVLVVAAPPGGAGAAAPPTTGGHSYAMSNDGTLTMIPTRPVVDTAMLAGSPGTGPVGVGGEEGPSPLSIIGPDDRQRIQDTTASVMGRSTVMLTYVNSSGQPRHYCSGFMYGPDLVVTAGHCVYDQDRDLWYNTAWNVVVWPGRNGSEKPYGSCRAQKGYVADNWMSGREDYDFGAFRIDCNVGNQTGWMGLYAASAAELNDQPLTIRGYPHDKAYGTQWWDTDYIGNVNPRRVFYNVDTYGGQSGSPAYNQNIGNCNSVCVLAIHAYGQGPDFYNSGTRITDNVINKLVTWRGLP